MGRLHGLSEEALEYFHTLSARSFKPKEAVERLYEAYPDEPKFGPDTFRAYLKSTEGAERHKRVLASVRERALELGFAAKGSRVDALAERAEALMAELRELSKQKVNESRARALSSLNAELRQTLKSIREETEPLNDAAGFLAPAQQFFAALAQQQRLENEDPN